MLCTWHCILSALPRLGRGLGHILPGLLADFLLQRRLLGAAAVRKFFSAPSKNKPSSTTQPFQHTCVACVKHFPFPPKGSCSQPPPWWLCRALAAVPQSLWSFSHCLDNNQHARGRHRYQPRGYCTSVPSLPLRPSLFQSHKASAVPALPFSSAAAGIGN